MRLRLLGAVLLVVTVKALDITVTGS